jgi:hypothetical protein
MLNINGVQSTVFSAQTSIAAETSAIKRVVGATADEEGINTLYGMAYELRAHNHGKSYCIPSLAPAIVLTGTSTSWELGAKVLLGTSVIASPFDFHHINVENMTGTDTFQIRISEGATNASTFIADVRVVAATNQVKQEAVPIITPILAANKKTHAQVANLSTTAKSVSLSFQYHLY